MGSVDAELSKVGKYNEMKKRKKKITVCWVCCLENSKS